MRILNLNPDTDIGASAWHIAFKSNSLLLDAGLHPGQEGRAALPLYDKIPGDELDAIALSHCHHDHVGSLPVAMRRFPQAHVIVTELTYFLVERVLHNSVNVMQRQREELGVREYPLFTHDEVDDLAPRIQGFKYNRPIEWASFQKHRAGLRSPLLEFFDAGHTLGSAGVLVTEGKQTLFYTGDVCFHDQTLLKAAQFKGIKADVLIMETTRGNRATPPGFTRAGEIERLAKSISDVIRRGGCALLPVFALGRTQEILALLALLMRAGKLKRQPIYIGGMGRVFTEIYDLQAARTARQHPGLRLTEALELIVLEPDALKNMKLRGGRIFVLTAGMMTEKTAAHDLALRMMGDAAQGIFFVGFAAPDSPAGRLRAAKPGETFVFSAGGGEATRKCHVEDFDLTAHAQREDLLDFVGRVNPRTVLLGHGDADARGWFAARIHERHPKIKVIQPQPGKAVEV